MTLMACTVFERRTVDSYMAKLEENIHWEHKKTQNNIKIGFKCRTGRANTGLCRFKIIIRRETWKC